VAGAAKIVAFRSAKVAGSGATFAERKATIMVTKCMSARVFVTAFYLTSMSVAKA